MKDNIFADLYDKVLSFFTSDSEDESKAVAKSRLKTVLMQDRVGFSERAMQMLKDDMIEAISKYLEINVDAFNLSIDANEETTNLNFSIPVLRTKTDDEIDEALAIAKQVKIDKTHEIVGEIEELVKEKAVELAQNIAEVSEDKNEVKEETTEENKNEAEEEAEETEKETQKQKTKENKTK